jgi:Fe-S-cluster containining protein
MAQPDVVSAEARAERFGFACGRCTQCCRTMRIQINPYEVARLAHNRGVSTSAFRERWTLDGEGAVIARTGGNACVFLGPEGCSVHADRPLVCRLYPLGRHIGADGSERFSLAERLPGAGGAFDADGTIAAFLEAQGAGPFMRAADSYFFWLCRAHDALDGADGAEIDAGDLLDMDAAIAAHCASTRSEEPDGVDARHRLHLEILDSFLETLKAKEITP